MQKNGFSAPTWIAIVAGLVVVAGGVYWLAVRDPSAAGAREDTPVASITDLHGMAVNPDDPRELYLATHHGLFRLTNDATLVRVGRMQDDLMGFSMHPENGRTFWTSGHPRLGGNMGVRQSMDGGYSWSDLALKGVDFHAMAVSPAEPDNLWGAYGGKLYRSIDGGGAWDTVSTSPPRISNLAGDPRNADTVYAATGDSIARSADGGATWATLARVPALAVALDPENPSVLYAGTRTGVSKSVDNGATWTATNLRAGDVAQLAIDPSTPATVYAGTYATGIYKTSNAGDNWRTVREPAR